MVSSIIALIIKSELLYQNSNFIPCNEEEQWIQFLNKLCEVVNDDKFFEPGFSNSSRNLDKSDDEKIIKTVKIHIQRFKERFTSNEKRLIRLLGFQYDLK